MNKEPQEYENIAVFRKQIKNAFDYAEYFGPVTIKRHGVEFVLQIPSESNLKKIKDNNYQERKLVKDHIVNEGKKLGILKDVTLEEANQEIIKSQDNAKKMIKMKTSDLCKHGSHPDFCKKKPTNGPCK